MSDSSAGLTSAVRQPAARNAEARVSRWLATTALYRTWSVIGSPVCSVEWASQLRPPKVGEVR